MNSKVEIMFKPLRQPFGYKYIMAILLNCPQSSENLQLSVPSMTRF